MTQVRIGVLIDVGNFMTQIFLLPCPVVSDLILKVFTCPKRAARNWPLASQFWYLISKQSSLQTQSLILWLSKALCDIQGYWRIEWKRSCYDLTFIVVLLISCLCMKSHHDVQIQWLFHIFKFSLKALSLVALFKILSLGIWGTLVLYRIYLIYGVISVIFFFFLCRSCNSWWDAGKTGKCCQRTGKTVGQKECRGQTYTEGKGR